MLRKLRLSLFLSFLSVLYGLCLPAMANTTKTEAKAELEPIANQLPNGAIPLASIALLLPARSSSLGRAADALRAGFLAAYERDHSGLAITVIEAADTAQDMLSAYHTASQKFDILVGPLSRTGITAIAQSGNIYKPTIALTLPELPADKNATLSRQLLPIGLSIETEARQVARWIADQRGQGKVLVVAAGASWQHRIAGAFMQEAANAGLDTELVASDLKSDTLDKLKQRVETEKPRALFLALDADQATQVRSALGLFSDATPTYGISQLNPIARTDNQAIPDEDRKTELNGIQLVDIPWLLQPNLPAVMAYPHQVADAGHQRNADLERLYALGIDAFNVAREVALQHTAFQINGVTGKLRIDFGPNRSTFERIEPTAIYRDGVVVPLEAR
ncbi:penicillin-binding protein activator [Glaciimonas soli]|uniref:Glycosylase n=1 Tax=Glaciimonas soli TaxID=2590999 RepID=A0A843YS13_9BURK|nr:penicillin-binding protein activator [Glaciimonas soli]MQR00514.1 glycosylase [Glaciimonas soli]